MPKKINKPLRALLKKIHATKMRIHSQWEKVQDLLKEGGWSFTTEHSPDCRPRWCREYEGRVHVFSESIEMVAAMHQCIEEEETRRSLPPVTTEDEDHDSIDW